MANYHRGFSVFSLMTILLSSIYLVITPDLWAATTVTGMNPSDYPAPNVGCMATDKCHVGIEPIRAHDSQMAEQIYAKGARLGDPNGCVICHGGNPKEEKNAKIAHTGAPKGGVLSTLYFTGLSLHDGAVLGIGPLFMALATDFFINPYRTRVHDKGG